jgi:putative membrane protein
MSIRRLMAMAAGGLVMTLATGQLSPLQAQGKGELQADAGIIREVTASNLLEVRLGELTRKMTSHPDVVAFGDRMITDHTNMYQQWNALYQQWTAEVGQTGKITPGLGQTQAAELKRMEKLSATEFDREYVATMIRHHQENVSYFQNAASSARSSQVRELVASGLPVLQQHLSMALQLGSQFGVAPAVATGNPNVPSNAPVANPNPPAPSRYEPVAGDRDLKKDSKFIREAVADNTLEIRLAHVAEQKTSDVGPRQLAKRVLDDHTAMQNRWLSLASRNGMNLKPGMGPRHMKKVKQLEKKSATEFDKAYLTMLIQSNQDYVEYFAKDGRGAKSAQVRNLAANDLTLLQQHLSEAKQWGVKYGLDTTAVLRARNLSSYRQ